MNTSFISINQGACQSTKVTGYHGMYERHVHGCIRTDFTSRNEPTFRLAPCGKKNRQKQENYHNGEFKPQIFDKYQRNADGIEKCILSLYATLMAIYISR